MASRTVMFTFIARGVQPGSCTCPATSCRVPAGWDRAHSDSLRPYTLDELTARDTSPHFYAYPTVEEYMAGWRLWRALRIDSRLTALEYHVKSVAVFEARGWPDMADQWRAMYPEFRECVL